MEVEKKNGKSIIVLVVVLIVIILGLVCYICYDKFYLIVIPKIFFVYL